MKYRFRRNLTFTVTALLFLTRFASAAEFDFGKLKVLKDARPGLWSSKFTTSPKNPSVPDREETVCLGKSQMAQAFREAAKANGQFCDVKKVVDGTSTASMILACPPLYIRELNIRAPGSNMPLRINKTSETKWIVQVDVPAVPNVTPKATWTHEYVWLRTCDQR